MPLLYCCRVYNCCIRQQSEAVTDKDCALSQEGPACAEYPPLAFLCYLGVLLVISDFLP